VTEVIQRAKELARRASTIRNGALLVALTAAAVANVCPGTADAADSWPCGRLVDRGNPTGWVQYCPLNGGFDQWVPVYKSPRWDDSTIVGWLTHRGAVNWFWCQTEGGYAWHNWRGSVYWAKTLSDIDASFAPRNVQGWVSETSFLNDVGLSSGGSTWIVDRDATLRWEKNGC
jgi:hypothetical protein